MKKNITLQQGFGLSIKESALIAKEVGFDGCFLSCEEGIIEDSDIEYIRSIGLEIETLHCQYNTPRRLIYDLWANNDGVQEAFDIIRNNIDFAAKHNIPAVIIHSSATDNPPEPNDAGLAWFNKLAKYCADRNIQINFENIKSLYHQDYLLKHVEGNNVAACFDIGHANGFTHNLNTYDFNYMFSKVAHLHLHDNDGVKDRHLIPGMGDINFVKFLKWIRTYNKDIPLTLELYYKGREEFYGNIEPKEFFKRAFDVISSIEKEVLKEGE